ncbi:hypothetical protein [Leptospira bandrabouensis]|uniref:hypothetical protein n=1 Tax=Leptospira bandrabouensis TaxID=2484903 RepID=UPI001EE8BB4F|nr:hypothetical protein [Leptospira bandrabouensis]MCG6146557.1 hypothetical protein [Leptospira bandrabouensis]MCG6161930.1 hypothetical protein [Leptospira bandrabouensis]MCG6166105.1 hypothetical protein [Leptospira bandrabouensis]
MIKIIKNTFLITIFAFSSNCIYFKQMHNLRYNDDCCIQRPNKIYLTINNKKPNLNDKFEKSFYTFLQHLLNKKNFSIITESEQNNDSIQLNVPFLFKDDERITVGGGRKYISYIKVPAGRIGIQGRKNRNSEPSYSMFIYLNSDYKYDESSKKYSIQNQESLLLKFALLYSSIINNLYSPPVSIEGKYIDLVSENIYDIKNENGKYFAFKKLKTEELNSGTKEPFLSFEHYENTQYKPNFPQFKGKAILYNSADIKLYQLGNMLLINNPRVIKQNIPNYNVDFYLDEYLLKIE